MSQIKISVAQVNPLVGDCVGNAKKLLNAWQNAAHAGADLVIGPELALSGYPLEDMALRPSFVEDAFYAIQNLAKETKNGPALIVGTPWMDNGKLYNAALLLSGGIVTAEVYKRDLPNYGPFDEKRVFTAALSQEPFEIKGQKIGLMICEDMWSPPAAEDLRAKGAQLLVVINGSPYETDKYHERQAIARARVRETKLPLLYVNLVGGQDELVFDGASFLMNNEGNLKARAFSFNEDLIHLTFEQQASGGLVPLEARIEPIPDEPLVQYLALRCGLQDYLVKNGITDVVLGLSGGIDSALVATLAVDALGAAHVHTVMMPSAYTSQESIDDADLVAHALGCDHRVLSITPFVRSFTKELTPLLGREPSGVTAENIQSRSRGLALMALSNSMNWLVLATGNKSEWATGYATLYGDMCGGFAPIKDVYKTDVYKIARAAVKRLGPVIPEQIFTKPPTAELRPNQTDQDTLPPYDILDDILRGLIERDKSLTSLVEQGYDLALVKRVSQMLQRAEYKRRQGPLGPKITRRHLTKDRRYPVTNGAAGV